MRRCAACGGSGVRASKGRTTVTCECEYRRAFRISLGWWRYLGATRSGVGRGEEYLADFELVARRALKAPGFHGVDAPRLFRLRFLEGLRWRACARELGTNQGKLFRAAYRVESVVGRALMEVRPYALFPPHGYF